MEILLENTKFSASLIAFLKRNDIQELLEQRNFKELLRRWDLAGKYEDDEIYTLFDELGIALPHFEFHRGICVDDWKVIVEYFKTLFPGAQFNDERIFRGANIESRRLRAAILGATSEHEAELAEILDNFHDWLDKTYPYYSCDFTTMTLSLGGNIVNGMDYTDFIDVVVNIGAV